MAKERILINADMAGRIYKARRNKKLTRATLAEMADIEDITVYRIEKCRQGSTYTTTAETVFNIADALGLDFKQIVGDLFLENSEKWGALVDKWKRIKENGEHWFTYSGSGWDDCLDDMNITCYDYPVEKLIETICGQGGRHLVLEGLKQYDEKVKSQN